MPKAIAALLLPLICLVGCSTPGPLPKTVGAFLNRADAVEVYALDPAGDGLATGEDTFHGWRVLGSKQVEDDFKRWCILNDLNRPIPGREKSANRPFKPRFGLRAKVGKQALDLVLCFEAGASQVYLEDGYRQQIPLGNAAESNLELELELAGVRPARKPQE